MVELLILGKQWNEHIGQLGSFSGRNLECDLETGLFFE
jgi:hypothetical protein